MCTIAFRPHGQSIEDATLRQMFINNPDGAGFMFAKNGAIHIRKGFMRATDFIEAYHAIPLGINLVIHTRIGTQGTNTAGNTHPYPVTTDTSFLKLTAIDVANGYAFAHNGILHDMRISGDYNDSQAFGVTFLAPLARLAENEPDGLLSPACRTIIEGAISGSRIAIMSTTGYVGLYGKGWVEDNGIYYSNSNYKAFERPVYYYGKNRGNSRYDNDDSEYISDFYGKNRGKRFSLND